MYAVTYYLAANPNEGFRKINIEIVTDAAKKYRTCARVIVLAASFANPRQSLLLTRRSCIAWPKSLFQGVFERANLLFEGLLRSLRQGQLALRLGGHGVTLLLQGHRVVVVVDRIGAKLFEPPGV